MDENARCGELACLLDQLEDLIEEGKTGFLSSRISVDREEMIEVIREIRLKLPTELQQSVWIVEERNKILAEAQKEAHLIIEEAHEKLENMTERHEITQYAKERAMEIIETARSDAREIQSGSTAYADDIVRSVELKLKGCLETVHKEMQDFEAYVTDVLRELYDNRQQLKMMNNQINEKDE